MKSFFGRAMRVLGVEASLLSFYIGVLQYCSHNYLPLYAGGLDSLVYVNIYDMDTFMLVKVLVLVTLAFRTTDVGWKLPLALLMRSV